jgi:hypothetical protein
MEIMYLNNEFFITFSNDRFQVLTGGLIKVSLLGCYTISNDKQGHFGKARCLNFRVKQSHRTGIQQYSTRQEYSSIPLDRNTAIPQC